MNKDDCFYFGTVIRSHGIDGTVAVAMDVDQPEHYSSLMEAHIFLNDTLIPFSVTNMNIQRDALIKFENINSVDDANMIAGCEIYLPLTQLPQLKGNEFYYHEIIGFTVIDSSFGEVGIVEQVFDMPQQAIAQVFHDGKEILIPLKLDLVTAIDRENKKLSMSLPEGLVELYLS